MLEKILNFLLQHFVVWGTFSGVLAFVECQSVKNPKPGKTSQFSRPLGMVVAWIALHKLPLIGFLSNQEKSKRKIRFSPTSPRLPQLRKNLALLRNGIEIIENGSGKFNNINHQICDFWDFQRSIYPIKQKNIAIFLKGLRTFSPFLHNDKVLSILLNW